MFSYLHLISISASFFMYAIPQKVRHSIRQYTIYRSKSTPFIHHFNPKIWEFTGNYMTFFHHPPIPEPLDFPGFLGIYRRFPLQIIRRHLINVIIQPIRIKIIAMRAPLEARLIFGIVIRIIVSRNMYWKSLS